MDIARREGKVTVDGLADFFGVTLQTIRRDLSELSESGKLERVHGGAILPSGTTNIRYDERRGLNEGAKTDIARVCARHIPDGSSVFLNIGTSTEAVARALLHHRDLLAVTNNINVANILAANVNCEVIVAGGALRRADGGLVGNLTIETIRRFKFDIAVIGCSAMDVDGDLMDFDIEEVGVSQTIIAHSRKTFLVADNSKLKRTAPARIASISDIDTFFTDLALPKALEKRCVDWGTNVVFAESV